MNTNKTLKVLRLLSVALIMMLFAQTNYGLTQAPSNSQSINRMVAIVNQSVISQLQLNQAMAQMQANSNATQQKNTSPSRLRKQALDLLINQQLQLDMAKRVGIKVSQSQITTAIKTIAKRNHISLQQLKAKLNQGHLSYSAYEQQIKTQMILSQVQQQALAGKVTVSHADIQAFINGDHSSQDLQIQYKYKDYLIPASAAVTTQQAQSWANHAYQALLNGQSLQALQKHTAKKQSTTLHFYDQWQTINNIPDLFVRPLKHLKSKHYSKPLVAANGVHILQLINKKKPSLNGVINDSFTKWGC